MISLTVTAHYMIYIYKMDYSNLNRNLWPISATCITCKIFDYSFETNTIMLNHILCNIRIKKMYIKPLLSWVWIIDIKSRIDEIILYKCSSILVYMTNIGIYVDLYYCLFWCILLHDIFYMIQYAILFTSYWLFGGLLLLSSCFNASYPFITCLGHAHCIC